MSDSNEKKTEQNTSEAAAKPTTIDIHAYAEAGRKLMEEQKKNPRTAGVSSDPISKALGLDVVPEDEDVH